MIPRIPPAAAWACAIAAMLLELTVTWGIPAIVPGYSLIDDYISTAGATDSPYPGWFAAAGITAAALHLGFVARLWQMDDARWHRIAAGLFGAFFVFLGLGLMFQCDPGCELETAEAWTHFWFGVAAFVALGVGAIVSMVTVWCAKTYRSEVVIATAIALVLFDIALLVSDLTKVYRGITERFVILTMMTWSIAWMLYLQRPDGARWTGFRKSSPDP